MSKTLIVALGNRFVSRDAAGVHLVDAFTHAGLPAETEVVYAGTDLLRVADQLRNRELIVLVDAAEGIRATVMLEHGSPQLDDWQQHAHHLSAVQALDLIRWSDESVGRARCVWLLAANDQSDTTARTAP